MKEWLRRLIKPMPKPMTLRALLAQDVTVEELREIIANSFPEYHLARNPGETRRKNREEKRDEETKS